MSLCARELCGGESAAATIWFIRELRELPVARRRAESCRRSAMRDAIDSTAGSDNGGGNGGGDGGGTGGGTATTACCRASSCS